MRVLHIYDGRLYGGVETLLATLSRHRHFCPGVEHEFALCFEGRLSRELEEAGAAVHWLGQVRLRDPISVWRGRRRLARMLDAGRFDMAVVHLARQQAIFGPVVRRARVPLVSWQHGPFEGDHWLERWAGTSAPRIAICNSRFLAGCYAASYPHTAREVLYYPVESPAAPLSRIEREIIRKELSTAGGATVIVQVSRMERWKGHLTHLEALARLTDLPGWVCWIVGGAQRPGEAGYLNQLRDTARRLAIEGRVRFLGERLDVRRLLAAADVFCQPNVGPEPFGIVFIEALYAGLPVISSAIGGALEIVDRTCGDLIAPGDARALAQSLRRFLEDSSARRNAGIAGVARARQMCDPRTQITRLSEVLGSL